MRSGDRQWAPDGDRQPSRGSTSSTPTRPSSSDDGWPRATTGATSWPRPSAGRCGARSSTPRSPARSAWRSSPTSWPCAGTGPAARERPHGAVPRHRPARRTARCAWCRATSAAARAYGDPVALARSLRGWRSSVDPRGRPRRGAHGRAGQPRRRVGDRHRPSMCRSRSAGGCAPQPTRRSSSTTGSHAWCWAPPRSRSPSSSRHWRSATRDVWRWGSTTAAHGRAGGAGLGAAQHDHAGRGARPPGGSALGAVVVTAIDRDGMLEGPDLTGCAACSI